MSMDIALVVKTLVYHAYLYRLTGDNLESKTYIHGDIDRKLKVFFCVFASAARSEDEEASNHDQVHLCTRVLIYMSGGEKGGKGGARGGARRGGGAGRRGRWCYSSN